MYYLTPWVKRLLIVTIGIHVLALSMPVLYAWGTLVPALIVRRPWTIVTYMFLHDPSGISHLLFNMLGLFFFGPRIEQRIGSADFLKLYFLGGIGGALASFVFTPGYQIVGASAAVFAVETAFAMYWPRERIYIWGILPVEAWLLITLLIGWSVWSGVTGSRGGVADFAHLGGIALGFGYMKWREWRRGAPRREFQRQAAVTPSATTSDTTALRRWESIDTSLLHELNRQEVESLLRKVRAEGVRVLSPAERAFLDRMSTRH
jgi:membrane associated rhomboid family serine protease